MRKKNPETMTIQYNKVPPQAREMEEAVLGAIMLEKGAFDVVAEILKPECFYVDAHQRIFQAMVSLSNKSQPIDALTVTEELRKAGQLDTIGGLYYLTKLTNSVSSSAHTEAHAQTIYDRYIQRKLIEIGSECWKSGYDESADPYDSLDDLQAKVNQLSTYSTPNTVSGIDSLLIERFSRIETLRHRKNHLTGVPTGIKPMDILTGGWQDTDLIIIAARPSVGKTCFALNLARNAARHETKPIPVAMFSMEMSKGQLTDRLLSAESGINLNSITRAKLDDEEMERLYHTGIQSLATYNLFFDDSPALNIYELKARCRKLKKDENIGLVIIDYLQLMSGLGGEKLAVKSQNREQEIAAISRGLKALAKELKIPVIALSQLSREIEKTKREPQLSDLRESGAIEADADVVIFLTRADYQQNEDEVDPALQSLADIHIKKHRNGSLAKIPMRTMLSIQRWFTDEEYEQYKQYNVL